MWSASALQYEVCCTNVLTMLDLGGIPLHSKDRTLAHPLVIAGGPGGARIPGFGARSWTISSSSATARKACRG